MGTLASMIPRQTARLQPYQGQNPMQIQQQIAGIRDITARRKLRAVQQERAEFGLAEDQRRAAAAPQLEAEEKRIRDARLSAAEIGLEEKKARGFAEAMLSAHDEPSYQAALQRAMRKKVIDEDTFLEMQNKRFEPNMVRAWYQQSERMAQWYRHQSDRARAEEAKRKQDALDSQAQYEYETFDGVRHQRRKGTGDKWEALGKTDAALNRAATATDKRGERAYKDEQQRIGQEYLAIAQRKEANGGKTDTAGWRAMGSILDRELAAIQSAFKFNLSPEDKEILQLPAKKRRAALADRREWDIEEINRKSIPGSGQGGEEQDPGGYFK